ncbi:hypothetical protein BN4901_2956 [Citrobacter europaeus]|uniref:Uncharacterized protein n=1 Tax=Citrobacter europaeus TaxID=1914243 RepID=A0ABY0JR10_9ENTR|nr:hypothetical protein BN4901_2956 [Citrobacter europaeus]
MILESNQSAAYIFLILFLGYELALKIKYAHGKMKSIEEKNTVSAECFLMRPLKTDG